MKILRVPQVSEMTGLSRIAIWRLEREQQFPKRVQLTTKTVGWIEKEVQEWMESLPRAVDAGSNQLITNDKEKSLSNTLQRINNNEFN
jgi:prophage regulatory protein